MSSEEIQSHPPAKRRRDEPQPDEIKRHDPLYFIDGDVVLLSLPKDHVVTAFRVDKVFLSRHSPVFKDMFSLPSPNDVEKYDDVPLVHLQDDAVHLISLLNALYDLASLPIKKNQCDTVRQVEGVLKLCTKYQINRLRTRIVDHLRADWPNDLTAWDINEQEIAAITKEFENNDVTEYSLDHILPEPCSAIRLARECDIPEILPAAFYHLSRIPPFADLDNNNNIEDDTYWDYVYARGRRARFGLLSRDDLMCLLKGIHSMAVFIQDASWAAHAHIRHVCVSKEPIVCKKAFDELRSSCEHSALRGRDPLHEPCLGQIPSRCEDLCKRCYFYFQQRMQAERRRLWESLPDLFGLPVVGD